MASITIDGKKIETAKGSTILEEARRAGIYIPVICHHPDLKPFQSIELSDKVYQGDKIFYNDKDADISKVRGCGICLVEIEGENLPLPACKTEIKDGMVIHTDSEKIRKRRQENLIPIMAKHPHSCLTCAQSEGCLLTSANTVDCSNSVPHLERCCELRGNCELQRIADYVGIAAETPKFKYPGIPRIYDGNMFLRDYNLCISCGRCVRACQQLRGVYVMGAVINEGKLVIGSVDGPTLPETECRFCGACVEVCPTGAIQDIKKPRLTDLRDLVPCKSGCPGEVEIPAYLRLITEGNYQKSAEVIASSLSFPHSLGKVCFHPCETDCRRNILSKAVNDNTGSLNIRAAKDFAMSRSNLLPPEIKSKTGNKVAIIGAGPAGLTAGYYLALNGHQVTIYEKESEIGGMLRYGIPRYRLSNEILEKDLNRIRQSGVEIKTNVDIGSVIYLSTLLNNGYNAIYLATGLSKSRRLPIEIPENSNILYGVEFLNKVSKKELPENLFENKNVVVIGGGNVATDAARTALRLHTAKTTIVSLEKFDEMPAYKQEIDEAIEEGIELKNGWGINSISVSENGMDINLRKCTSVFDEKGHFNPKYDDELKDKMFCDYVIICIGQQSEQSVIIENDNISIFQSGLVKIKNGTSRTEIPKLFAGGDIVSGPKSVIDAVANGKEAAREIDSFLGGSGTISGDDKLEILFDSKIGKIENFARLDRVAAPLADIQKRKTSFDLVDLGYNVTLAEFESRRCLQCNLRIEIGHNPFPPAKYLEFSKSNIDGIIEEEGVVQLLDENREVYLIKGSDNIKKTLLEFFDSGKEAKYFSFEYDQLFSQRESELLQQYLGKHGSMPDIGDDLDDLF